MSANVKCVCVGDNSTGRTCMLTAYATKTFPSDAYIPTESRVVDVTRGGKSYWLCLWDIGPSADDAYAHLRAHSYDTTNVFLVCFDISNRCSLDNACRKWMPEVKHSCPNTPFILVGLKSDLRSDERYRDNCVTVEEAKQCAVDINADCYIECSALQQSNLDSVFNKAVDIAVLEMTREAPSRQFKWPWQRSGKQKSGS